MIERVIGFSFMIVGIAWSIIDRFLCRGLCSTCTTKELSPCFFLFLFVGIIFVVTGYNLASMKETQLPKVRLKKISKKQ